MRIPRVFCQGLALNLGDTVSLPDFQSNYVLRALRLKESRPLWVFNGGGGAYFGRLASIEGRTARVFLESFQDDDLDSALDVRLAIGLSKGDRFDWVVQKATELGVSQIVPLQTARSEVRLSTDRFEKKQQHWFGIAASACEQSGRNRLPTIQKPSRFDDYLNGLTEHGGTSAILALDGAQPFTPWVLSQKQAICQNGLQLLIGPEGGFDDDEVQRAVEKGVAALHLGRRVLRTETAPVAALAILQALAGDLSGG